MGARYCFTRPQRARRAGSIRVEFRFDLYPHCPHPPRPRDGRMRIPFVIDKRRITNIQHPTGIYFNNANRTIRGGSSSARAGVSRFRCNRGKLSPAIFNPRPIPHPHPPSDPGKMSLTNIYLPTARSARGHQHRENITGVNNRRRTGRMYRRPRGRLPPHAPLNP